MVNRQEYVDMVGFLIEHDQIADRFRIDNLYLYRLADGTLTGNVRHRGIDYPAHCPMARMLDLLDDTWAPAILKKWSLVRGDIERVFYQFGKGCTPESLGLGPDWRVLCEL